MLNFAVRHLTYHLMHITDDGRRAHLNIDRTFTGAELETLISDLADLRAKIQPAVPMNRPLPGEADTAERLLTQDEPSVLAVPLRNGRIRLWLRNSGLGWLIFNFTVTQAVSLRDFFIANTPEKNPEPGLFSNDDSGPDRAH